MQLIPLEATTLPLRDDAAAGVALAGVIASIGAPGFGGAALAQLNRWMPLCWWSVYRLFDDAPPTLHALGCLGAPDGTQASWQVYRDGLYRRDDTFSAARDHVRGDGGAVLTHWHAGEIRAPHRHQIYLRHGLRERLSLVCDDTANGLLAINLYRHHDQAAFSNGDIDRVQRIGALLLACVQRHVELVAVQVRAPATSALDGLTRREREVCTRLLKGLTHDGIAADLGLQPSTVKTYRDRAFDKLGIRHRNELFALLLPDGLLA